MACTKTSVVNDIHEINGPMWNSEDIKSFDFAIDDTTSGYDFHVLVRNDDDYPYRNLYLFVNLEFPDNRITSDTIYCELANKAGKWLGKGFGSHHNSEILYKDNQQFPMKGEYKVSIEQAMRQESLPGITDVGISIRENK
ncbi:MAG: gliding motility-associated lipoprotein GldH [Patiriisocius sp.]|jgi:gliding motility-associated lipoprotein GldH